MLGMSEPPPLTTPADIPWTAFTGEALEELLYWLCVGLGASDLEWRAGSNAGTSRDRGRDLEATFYVPEPGGELRPEHWWIQAKGRSKTVEPQAVREAVMAVQAAQGVDALVIATNSRFSNDTRDWVRDFQANYTHPAIKLWDRDQLERMLVDQPSVVSRVAPAALSPAGRLKAASDSLWNHQRFPTPRDLNGFWADREMLEFDYDEILMCVLGEAASGDLLVHPWGSVLGTEALAGALVHGLVNAAPLIVRIQEGGNSEEPVSLALAHLLACALVRLNASTVTKILSNPWAYAEDGPDIDKTALEHLRGLLLEPIVQRMVVLYGNACIADCERVLDKLTPDEEERPPERYWASLAPIELPALPEKGDRVLIIEQLDAPCRAGLQLSAEHGCPFVASDSRTWDELLPELQTVFSNRLAALVEKADTDGSEQV